MHGRAAIMLTQLADAAGAGQAMKLFVAPIMTVVIALASLACVFFLVNGGIAYMTSSGKPDKLDHAKTVIRNSLVGLVVVIAAVVMTSILSHAYQGAGGTGAEKLPALIAIQPAPTSPGLVDILVKAIIGLFQHIIQSAAGPFIKALDYFTKATPLMAANSSVFNLWLAVVGMADALFVLVVALLGFHVMSATSLGLDEIEIKHMLPQLAAAFLAINVSIFAIDGIISLSNAMIHALLSGFPDASVWQVLSEVAKQSAVLGLVALLIMVAFLILAVVLLVYYVGRLVTLYVGAILSPLVVLLWLVPGFKDFAHTAIKTYLATIFVLFVHVLILLLAASIFAGMVAGGPNTALDPIMATVVGVAVLVSLLKTQGLMMQLSYASMGPKAMRKLGSQFVTSVSYATSKVKAARAAQ